MGLLQQFQFDIYLWDNNICMELPKGRRKALTVSVVLFALAMNMLVKAV